MANIWLPTVFEVTKGDLCIYKVCGDMTLLEQGEGGKGRNIHDIQQSQLHLVMLYI